MSNPHKGAAHGGTRRTFLLPGSGSGIRCPKCHCRDCRVTRTAKIDAFIRRERVCRNCGHKLVTFEKTANE